MAVITALELDDGIAPGITPGKADGAHGGLGAGVDHAHQVHAGHDVADAIRQLYFQLRRGAEAEPLLALLYHRLAHRRVVVSHDHRAPGQHVVDVAFALGIEYVGALTALDEYGCAAHGLERPHR